MNKSLVIFFLFTIANSITVTANNVALANLRCEYQENPVGVENTTPRFSWELLSSQFNVKQIAYRVMVSDDSLLLRTGQGNVWDSKKINSSQSIQVHYKGLLLRSAKHYYWKVMAWDNKGNISAWSATQRWQMGLLSKKDWLNAAWIGYDSLPASKKIIPAMHGNGEKTWGSRPDVLPLLRKVFPVDKSIKNASVFISGLGQFELHINGQKVGDHFLDPGWTKYDKHALYVSFDVTKQLRPGSNAIGVMLGNGFYYIPGERYRKLTGAYGYPKMICRLHINYTDGSTDDIVSDNSWRTSGGPITFSSIYGGETYNANLEQQGWDEASFNDATWQPAVIVESEPALQSQTAAPVKIFDTLDVKQRSFIQPGVYVYDLGQNAAAIPYIKLQGKKGDTVRIIPGELLNAEGRVSQRSSGGPYYLSYVLKGDSVETWQPRFTYYGFRYLQIENAVPPDSSNTMQQPVMLAVKGLHIHAAYPKAGTFNCSNELFNKTEKLIGWAVKSNMVSIFTDCPHRERLGWQEQLHLMGPSLKYNYDIASFGSKLVSDIGYAQQADGLIPSTIPEYTEMHFANGYFRDSPEWGSNGIIMPWYLYQWYGDKQLLANSYPIMKKYLAYLQTKDSAGLLMYGLSDWYDIGPERSGFSQMTPMGLTATAIYYYDLIIMQQVASLLHQPLDSIAYRNKANDVKLAFNKKFFSTTTNRYGTGSQASNAMAVYMNLVSPENKQAVMENIVAEIKTNNYKLTAGDIGYRYLLRVLEEAGRSDVIFDMNRRSDVPGYGYQISKGATALTESWQASPQVSNNHFMLGHILEWFYSGLAGIKEAPGAVAFQNIIIDPQLVGDISSAAARYHSPYGWIESSWNKNDNDFYFDVTIPANTTAEIRLPAAGNAVITVNGKALNAFSSIKQKGFKNKTALLVAGSGEYHFKVSNKE